MPRPQGELLDLRTTYLVSTKRPGSAQEAIHTLTFTKLSSSDSDNEDVGRTGEGIESSGGDAEVCQEPCRYVTLESMTFSSHWSSAMSRSRLRPAEPLIDLYLLRREGVVQIQALGTCMAGLNRDAKRSESLHKQLAKHTLQVQLTKISPHDGARSAGGSNCRSLAHPSRSFLLLPYPAG